MRACRMEMPISSVFAGWLIGEWSGGQEEQVLCCTRVAPATGAAGSNKVNNMNSRNLRWQFTALALLGALHVVSAANEFDLDGPRPTCGKVCKLVCETKKLTDICYGSECKDICLPDPSRPGCKHCAVCCGKCAGDGCCNCQSCPPKCEFCWRDWFACGCAQPRTVRVLTKYQAEKKICWYHWEVVDAACCDCVGTAGPSENHAVHVGRSIYKSAPDNVRLGEVLPVSNEEWVKLAAVLSPDPSELAAGSDRETTSNMGDKRSDAISPDSGTKASSVAERFGRLLKK